MILSRFKIEFMRFLQLSYTPCLTIFFCLDRSISILLRKLIVPRDHALHCLYRSCFVISASDFHALLIPSEPGTR